MATINAYLCFNNGKCEEAFNFYKSVFGGEFDMVSRFKDEPPMEGIPPVPENAKNLIMNMSLPISKETSLMGSDAHPGMGAITIGQNISLTVSVESKSEADRIFKKLSEGGKITMPIADTFWNAYFGMLTDKYQNIWMVMYSYPQTAEQTRGGQKAESMQH